MVEVDQEYLDELWAAVAPRLQQLRAEHAVDMAVGLAACRYSRSAAFEQVGWGCGGVAALPLPRYAA